MSKTSRSHREKETKRQRWPGALALLGLAALLGQGSPAQATSLDGAGRIVVVPYVLSGIERESTIYLTNPGGRTIEVFGKYVGADGTPFAASTVGVRICGVTRLSPGESQQVTLSQLCPLGTPDVANFGYLELSTFGGFDTNPFFATSIVTTRNGDEFGVEGYPVGAFEPSATSLERTTALRVIGLEGTIPTASTVADQETHCYLGALAEDKDVTVQLMEYSTGSAHALGTPTTIRLKRFTMVKLSNVLATAGLPLGVFSNLTVELYAGGTVGSDLVAGCSIETLKTRTEDFRLATTPAPHDRSRARSTVRGDTQFRVGPVLVGYGMLPGSKARMALYLRHEDRARCRIVPSVLRPYEDPTPWQELRVLNPDGAIVAGGSGASDTGTFFTGAKNDVARGVNGRWVVEVAWRGTPASGYPPTGLSYNAAFGVLCESAGGMSTMLPLDLATDDF